MPVSKELLDILVCPLCRTPVNLTPAGDGLKCKTCRRVYPVRGDIPIMLIDEAKVEQEEDNTAKES
ncbi:MAG: Trm112 family protein [Acidobacteriota bacterium]|nr:Trm112 family protein [Acidobacteriota bacterium]MDE3169312.1 Trm112 family protein [Acidobacteriota bacterium]